MLILWKLAPSRRWNLGEATGGAQRPSRKRWKQSHASKYAPSPPYAHAPVRLCGTVARHEKQSQHLDFIRKIPSRPKNAVATNSSQRVVVQLEGLVLKGIKSARSTSWNLLPVGQHMLPGISLVARCGPSRYPPTTHLDSARLQQPKSQRHGPDLSRESKPELKKYLRISVYCIGKSRLNHTVQPPKATTQFDTSDTPLLPKKKKKKVLTSIARNGALRTITDQTKLWNTNEKQLIRKSPSPSMKLNQN